MVRWPSPHADPAYKFLSVVKGYWSVAKVCVHGAKVRQLGSNAIAEKPALIPTPLKALEALRMAAV